VKRRVGRRALDRIIVVTVRGVFPEGVKMTTERRNLYIDNSNIFRGCKKAGWRPSYHKVHEYLSRGGPIQTVHFFASEQPSPRLKQAAFYQSLKKELGFTVHASPLAQRRVTCPQCSCIEWVPAEKGVDVGLVSQLLLDHHRDLFETAMIMSSDLDYLDAMLAIAGEGKNIEIIAWKWTLPHESVTLCRHHGITVTFLEDRRSEFEKPASCSL
jgi:uncharacterized LabA/DUF88 family protein